MGQTSGIAAFAIRDLCLAVPYPRLETRVEPPKFPRLKANYATPILMNAKTAMRRPNRLAYVKHRSRKPAALLASDRPPRCGLHINRKST